MICFRHFLAVVRPMASEATGIPLEHGDHRWQATCADFPCLIGTGPSKREAVADLEFWAQSQVRRDCDKAPEATDYAYGKVYIFSVECDPDAGIEVGE